MKQNRASILVIALLALVVSACSQSSDLQTPELDTQFGTYGNDAATAVSVAANGVITKAVRLTFGPFESSTRPTFWRTKLVLRQLDSTSKLLRQIDIGTFECATSYYDCDSPSIIDVQTDRTGNTYAMQELGTAPGDMPQHSYTLYKYGPAGKLLWKRLVASAETGDPEAHFMLDSKNNVFVSRTAIDSNGYTVAPSFVRYSPSGVKWYQRNSQIGLITDLAVSSSGDVYIVGEKGLSRYNNGGVLIWTKAIPGKDVAATQTHSFVLESNTLYQIDMQGNKVTWDMLGATTSANSIETDTLGNLYIRGYEDYSPDDVEEKRLVYIQKIDMSGAWKNRWMTSLPFPDDTTLQDTATYDGSSIYAVGSTRSPVNVANHGEHDAFIVRLNAQGQQLWER